MDLSIIVLSFNTSKLTITTLKTIVKSLLSSKIKYEIIVWDNASSDDSVSAITRFQKEHSEIALRLIAAHHNSGFSRGNNLAVKEARGKYLLFLNSDIEVLDQAIEKLFRFYLENETKYQILGAKLYNLDRTPQASAGPFYSLPVIFAALFLRGDYYGLTRYSPNKIQIVDWVSGACFLIKKTLYEELGGFDEQIFMYMEEIDLMYRAKQKKYHTAFYPEAHFIHVATGSAKNRTNPILNVYKGFLYFYQKHHNKTKNIILRLLLKVKALIGYNLGVLFNNSYLKETYGQAAKMV